MIRRGSSGLGSSLWKGGRAGSGEHLTVAGAIVAEEEVCVLGTFYCSRPLWHAAVQHQPGSGATLPPVASAVKTVMRLPDGRSRGWRMSGSGLPNRMMQPSFSAPCPMTSLAQHSTVWRTRIPLYG